MARAVAIALAFLVFAGTAADATQRTTVTVKFVLKAYRGEDFDDAESNEVQKRAAEWIVKRLREHVPFLGFTTQEGSEFTLTATLRESSAVGRPQAPREVGFSFKLDGPRVQANEEYVVFRPPADLSGISTKVDDFVEEIDRKLTEETYRGRLRPLLCQVPIAKTGQVVTGPAPGWVLPHKRNDICLDFQSQLRIEHVVQFATVVRRMELYGRADGELQGQIFGSPVDLLEFRQQLGAVAPDQVSVTLIWVKDYRDLVPCSTDFGK
ncbi:MAG: hypothetical protein M1335_00930 [Chloroflexi bacterium]|nr:hypothetical protein [Chloroflexota bacterium]